MGSKATEQPNLEKQASLLQWGEDKLKLEGVPHPPWPGLLLAPR